MTAPPPGGGWMTPRLLRNIQAGGLYALLLLLPFSKASVEILFGVLLLGWGLERSRKASRRQTIWLDPALRPLALAIGAYMTVCTLSVLGSDFRYLSLRGLIGKWLEYLMFLVIIADIARKPGVAQRSLWMLAGSSSAVALYGLGQDAYVMWVRALKQAGAITHYPAFIFQRMTGPYENPVDLATYLMVAIPVLLGLALSQRGRRRVGLFVLLGLLTLCVARTASLGAWIGLWIGLLVMSCCSASARRWGLLLLLGSVVGGGLFLQGTGRLKPVMSFSETGKIDRVAMWQAALNMIQDRPVLGHGVNTFMSNYLKYWVGGERQPRYAHNCYLQVAAETGLVGLATFLVLLWQLFVNLIDGWRRRAPPDERLFLLGLIGGLLSFAVHAAVDTDFYSLRQAALFWSLAGLAVGLAHPRRPRGMSRAMQSIAP